MLEKGRTSGVSGRLLCNTDMRTDMENAEKEELEREQKEKEMAKAGNTGDKDAAKGKYMYIYNNITKS